MKKLILSLLFSGGYFMILIMPFTSIAQQNLSLLVESEGHSYHIFAGIVDDMDTFEIYLEERFDYCNDQPFPKQAKIITGWFLNKNKGTKIPVTGYICRRENCDNYLRLIVLEDPFKKLKNEDCTENPGSEVLIQEEAGDRAFWLDRNKKKVPIYLRTVHKFSYHTDTWINIFDENEQVARLNFSEISGNAYIDNIEILGQKSIKGRLHTLLEYSNLSNPASGGLGRCGAGEEKYLAYLAIDELNEVSGFKKVQTESCLFDIYDVEVSYDIEYPEDGFEVN